MPHHRVSLFRDIWGKRRGVLLLMALLLITLGVSRVISFRNSDQLIRGAHLLNRAQEARENLAELSSSLRKAQWLAFTPVPGEGRVDEASARGAISSARRLARNLDAEVPFNPALRNDLRTLKTEADQCCDLIEASWAEAEPREPPLPAGPAALIVRRERLDSLLQRIDDTEEKLLREIERITAASAVSERSRWLIFHAITLLQAALFLLLCVLLLRYLRHRERAEESQRDAAERYRIIADNTYNWEYWLNPSGRMIYCSPACERLTGYSPQEFEEAPGLLDRIIHPDFSGLFDAHRHDVLTHETSGNLECQILHKDGSARWISHVCQPVFGVDGRFLGNRGSNHDITARKEAEIELKNAYEVQETILNGSLDAAGVLDARGVILAANERGAKALGKTPREIIGTSFWSYFPPDVAHAREEILKEVFREGKPVTFEEKQGTRFFENRLCPLRNERGEVVKLVGFSRNITKSKRASDLLTARLRLLERSSTDTLEQFLRAALDEAELLTESTIGFFHFLDPAQKIISRQAWSTNTTASMGQPAGGNLHYEVAGAGIWADAIRERRPVIHNDCASLLHGKSLPEGHAPLVRELVVPVFRDNLIVAILGVGNKATPYEEDDIQLVSQFADMAWDLAERWMMEGAMGLQREIARHASEGINLVDAETMEILYANPRMEEMFGYLPGEMNGRPVSMLNLPTAGDSPDAARQIEAGLREAGAWHGEVLNSRKDGTTFWSMASISTFQHSEYGKVYLTLQTDITDHKRAEGALRESEERFRLLFQRAPIAYQSLDGEGRILEVNQQWLALLGYSHDEVIGRWIGDFLVPDSVDRLQTNFPRFLAQGQITGAEFQFLRRDGETVLVLVDGKIGRDTEGRFQQTHCTLHDITMQRRAEEALRKSEERYRTFINATSDLVFLKDESFRFLLSNPAMRAFLGRPDDDLVGLTDFDLLPVAVAEKCRASDLEALDRGEVLISEEAAGERVLQTTKFPVPLPGGQMGLGGYIRDITEHKLAETAIEQSRIELMAIYENAPVMMCLADATGQVRYTNRALAEFTGRNESELVENQPGEVFGCIRALDDPRGCGFGEDCSSCTLRLAMMDAVTTGRSHRGFEHSMPVLLSGIQRQATLLASTALVESSGEKNILICLADITERKNAELAILRRDAILSAVAFASEALLRRGDWESSIPEVLEKLGRAGSASRAYLFQRHPGPGGVPCVSQRYEWVAAGIEPQLSYPALQSIPFTLDGFSRWHDALTSGEPIAGLVRDFPAGEKDFLEPLGVSSIACLPIIVRGEAWGFIGFNSCAEERTWDKVEIEAFKAAAAVIGAAIQQQTSKLGLMRRQEAMQLVNQLATGPSAKRFEDLCHEVAPAISRILNVPHAKVKRIEGEAWTVVAEWEDNQFAQMRDTPLCDCPCWEIWRSGQPFQRQGVLASVYCKSPYFPEGEEESFLGVPIMGETREVKGTLSVICPGERKWDEDEIHVLEIFARYLSFEMEKSRLDDQLQRDQGMKVLGQLAAGVSHEVRNPLNAILGLTDVLAQDLGQDPGHQEIFTHIRRQVDRLADLMHDLLELGKPIERAKMNRASLSGIVQGSVTLFAESPVGRQHAVEFDAKGVEPGDDVLADQAKLQQAFLNLLENAGEHSPPGCPVRVDYVRTSPAWACVRFVDRGSGIPEKNISRLFEPFFTTRKGGTGLGLSIVRHLIEAHGGSVLIRNSEGQPGTTVEVKLPVAAAEVEP